LEQVVDSEAVVVKVEPMAQVQQVMTKEAALFVLEEVVAVHEAAQVATAVAVAMAVPVAVVPVMV
jgi:hypothetical protein